MGTDSPVELIGPRSEEPRKKARTEDDQQRMADKMSAPTGNWIFPFKSIHSKNKREGHSQSLCCVHGPEDALVHLDLTLQSVCRRMSAFSMEPDEAVTPLLLNRWILLKTVAEFLAHVSLKSQPIPRAAEERADLWKVTLALRC
jgi:hypothetical protein